MSDLQNFIDVPTGAQRFVPRTLQSMKTSLAFIVDQRWASLIFLLVYLGLMYWDYQSALGLPTPPPPEWTENWPEFLDPIKTQLAREGLTTWRAMLAGFVTLLYWGNALLYIADRSAAFPGDSVVGLGRYILRGMAIAILLSVPLGIGLMLLIIPGLLVAGIMMAAATITMFREFGIFRAIGEGFRVITQNLPGQKRILGFSRSFVHIVGAYGLVIVVSFLVTLLAIFVASGLGALVPALSRPLGYLQSVLSNLIGSFLNLSFSIFVLKLYAEYRTLMRS
ncbi:hypothetical protein [Oligoflexus tunisiensis]|uniref:hypothetical protein n=1 Tax=Oligoflexus tunisiensis TaxID=708132 RepID=UPI00114D1123|nr:hypothetical protein [Oligoflexus tunisiensis]